MAKSGELRYHRGRSFRGTNALPGKTSLPSKSIETRSSTISKETDITVQELKENFGFDPDAPAVVEEDTPIRQAQEALTRRLTVQASGEDSFRSIPGGYEFRFRPVVDLIEDESDTQQHIRAICDEYRDFLLAKNKQYGDSAVNPVRIFSKASPEEQLLVRIDDKLSRLVRGNASLEPDEDIMDDLVGYWLLLKAARRKASA